jgi:phosphoglycolate phosphatase
LAADILLDLDGTLTDPFPGISRCIIYALAEQGFQKPDPESLKAWVGPPLRASFASFFEQHGGGDTERALLDYRERFASKGLFENAVYDGIPELLGGWQRSGRRLLLATSKPTIFAEKIVRHFKLDQYLDYSYGAELDGRRADKVDLLQYIIDQQQLDPPDCVMVGDRKYDMLAAGHHGIKSVGVLWGYGSEQELLGAGAETLVSSPAQLLGLT